MEILAALLIILIIAAGITLDLSRRTNIVNKYVLALVLIIYPNIVVILAMIKHTLGLSLSKPAYSMLLGFILVGYIYMVFKINFTPIIPNELADTRLNIMFGGRTIIYCGLYTFAIQGFVYLLMYTKCSEMGIGSNVITAGAIYSIVSIFLLLINGILRVFFTSFRLGIKTRVLMLVTMWIPIVNLFVLINACRLVYDEYDFVCNKKALDNIKIHSYECETKYPILLVHGLSFRDLKYYNYWGRIPAGLVMNGATIYYCHDESLGNVINNGEKIQQVILDIVKATGCEKVNIIAHSKGGLDARYAIRMYGIDKYVASLTTIATPHRGSWIGDFVCRLPEGFYRSIASHYNKLARKNGDNNPDFYTATRQYSTETAIRFNDSVHNSNKVYYQSYASKTEKIIGNGFLGITAALHKNKLGDNDGIVSVESAKWGTYKGTISSTRTHGVSHLDLIDRLRHDFKGYDVIEEYIEMVHELKEKGY